METSLTSFVHTTSAVEQRRRPLPRLPASGVLPPSENIVPMNTHDSFANIEHLGISRSSSTLVTGSAHHHSPVPRLSMVPSSGMASGSRDHFAPNPLPSLVNTQQQSFLPSQASYSHSANFVPFDLPNPHEGAVFQSGPSNSPWIWHQPQFPAANSMTNVPGGPLTFHRTQYTKNSQAEHIIREFDAEERIATGKEYECLTCNVQFVSHANAQRHCKKDNWHYYCPKCFKKYSRDDYRKSHEKRCRGSRP